MVVVNVALGANSYPIIVEPGCSADVGPWLAARQYRHVHVISQDAVWQRHGPAVQRGLEQAGLWAGADMVSLVPDGEAAKSWDVAGQLLDALVRRRLDRGAAVIAVGGGVVGDVAGFAAATYLRGVPFVQVPTTLLAQVDAAVGGKTGINHPLGKNLIGAFHQPVAVFADPEVLRTLPGRDLRAGLAECVKHGLIASEEYLDFIGREAAAIIGCEPDALARLVADSCRIKAEVVGTDERESGRRAVLNLGHTVAHALEAVARFSWRHGEAVAVGTVAAVELSHRLGLCSPDLPARVTALLGSLGLPVRVPDVPADALLDATLRDKKRRDGRQTWVLVRQPGDVVLRADVPDAVVQSVLRGLGAA